MNPVSYSSLLASRPALEPVPVDIEGIPNPVLIHLFTIADYSAATKVETDDDEVSVRVQILRFLGGLNADVSAAAVEQLNSVFTAFQLREIYRKAVRVNGHGPAALGDAEKK